MRLQPQLEDRWNSWSRSVVTMQDKLAFIARCFAFADQDRKVRCCGFVVEQLLLSQLFLDVADKDGGSELRVSLDVFTKVIAARLSKPELLEDVRRLFKAMDLRAEGFISFQSFQKVGYPFITASDPIRALSKLV
ncbi:hypothetical protein BBJ28_00017051 [Nothophytophthora sp. Chile5]|nr:hypothetical protein BBJ28_00017051 [Nothophytophthora sp. Chile5]